MKKTNFIYAALFSLILFGCTETSQLSVQDTINQNKAAVLLVITNHGNNPITDEVVQGIGTGFLVKENQIVTNSHVIGESDNISIRGEYSPQEYKVKVLFNDPYADIAVLEIVDWDIYKKENNVRYLNFADSSRVQTVDEVYAIGNPWGLLFSVSKGIISHSLYEYLRIPAYLIQVDAHVYNGNSGGPLLNTKGEVIGVNSLMMAQTGGSYGFAIHSNIVSKIINDWKEFGMARWSFLGIFINDRMVIESVSYNSAAMLAGLRKGDTIHSMTANGKKYIVNKPLEFKFVLASYQYNDSIEILIEREDGLHLIKVNPKYKLSSEFSK